MHRPRWWTLEEKGETLAHKPVRNCGDLGTFAIHVRHFINAFVSEKTRVHILETSDDGHQILHPYEGNEFPFDIEVVLGATKHVALMLID